MDMPVGEGPVRELPDVAGHAPLGASLHLHHLVRTFPDGTRAVDDVSLAIPGGRFLTLLGPSGSGKTTTLKMIAGFEVPDAGAITLGGRDISATPAHARGIGMVFQNYALFPHMTVSANVAFPLRMRRRPRREVDAAVRDALALVQLDGFGARYPRQLSGGQQQRVALARAIVFRPPLLLMDEPLGALDRQLRKAVQSELKRIHRQLGLTVVYVTHDQDEALFLSDEIAIMQAGRIVQSGTPETLYSHPDSRFVASFLGESNFLPGTVASVADGYATVALAKGHVRGRAAGRLAPGMRVDALVRPEKLDLHADTAAGAGHPNLLQARVEMVNFMGSAQEYELDLGGARLAARLYLRALPAPFGPGQTVLLSFAPDDCLVFAA